jgi:cystathionine beta-lyase
MPPAQSQPHPLDEFASSCVRHPVSAKWTKFAEGVLPMWVADMDFPIAPAIAEALRERVSRSIGYAPEMGDTELVEALLEKHAPHLTLEHLRFLPSVVPGLYAAVAGLTSPGEAVITHTPVYPPFLSAIESQGRVARHAPLALGAQGWEMDWDALEAAVTPDARLLMLCSPQNPTGRVWTRAELERLADLVLRHRLWVVSDELHADLTFDGPFVPFASIDPEVAQRTVTLTGPGKAFNTSGVGVGLAYSDNAALMARLTAAAGGLMGHPSTLAYEIWKVALAQCGPWLEDTRAYLRGNRDALTGFLRERMPAVGYVPPQGTYLAWLDFRAYPWAADAQAHLLEHALVGLNEGKAFGPEGEGFARLNFATPRPLLLEGLERIASSL